MCPWPGPNFTEAAKKGRAFSSPITAEVLAEIEANDWELYDLTKDYAETRDVAAENRAKVIEMVGRWWTEAGKYGVMPLDGDARARMALERPTIARPRDKFVFYPGGSPVPFAAAPKVYNRPFSIIAEAVVPDGGAEGILIAQGGRVGGYAFFVKDHKLHFVYNYLGRDTFVVTSNADVPTGEVSLRYEFEPTGSPDLAIGEGVPGRGGLYIDQKLVGTVEMPHTVPIIFSTEGLTCGYDGGSRVAADIYADEFRFTGTIKQVTIDLAGELIDDGAHDLKIAMARQ